MNTSSIWLDIRYALFLLVSLFTCTIGFNLGFVSIPFVQISIPIFLFSTALVSCYTLIYSLYYHESGTVTLILSIICSLYPFIEFQFGILLIDVQSSVIVLTYGIGLLIGSGVTVVIRMYNKQDKLREFVTAKSQNKFK